MGWEKRGNRKYFYQARRVEGKVVKTYIPADQVALIDFENALDNWGQELSLRKSEAGTGQLGNLESIVADFDQEVDDLITAMKIAAGFQLHKGQWRLKRT